METDKKAVKSVTDEEIPIPVKPVSTRIEDFKKNLNKVVAESELPSYLLEPYLEQILTAISKLAGVERNQDAEEWEKACKEYEKKLKAHKEGEKDG